MAVSTIYPKGVPQITGTLTDIDSIFDSFGAGEIVITPISPSSWTTDTVGLPSDSPYQYGTLITIKTSYGEWASFQMFLPDTRNSVSVYFRSGKQRRWLRFGGTAINPLGTT